MEKEAELIYLKMKSSRKRKFISEAREMNEGPSLYHSNKEPGFIAQLKLIAKDSKIGYYFYSIRTGETTFSQNLPKMIDASESEMSFRALLAKIVNRGELFNAIRNLFKSKTSQQINLWLAGSFNSNRCITVEIRIYDEFIMFTAEDISLQKAYENQLLDINKELEAFLYKSSHNLKGPAASISGLVSIAMHEVKDEGAVKYLNMIKESTEKLNFVLNDLLNVNKIKLGHLEFSEIKVDAVVNDVMEALKFLTGSHDVQINLSIAHKKPFVSDQSMVYSIFQNLIENSIKYSSKSMPYLNISSKDVDNGIEFTFEDNGQGIPEHAQDKIFNMFYRANDLQKGSGLGLYIVKTAVQKLGGNIMLSSIISKGSTFKVFLPTSE